MEPWICRASLRGAPQTRCELHLTQQVFDSDSCNTPININTDNDDDDQRDNLLVNLQQVLPQQQAASNHDNEIVIMDRQQSAKPEIAQGIIHKAERVKVVVVGKRRQSQIPRIEKAFAKKLKKGQSHYCEKNNATENNGDLSSQMKILSRNNSNKDILNQGVNQKDQQFNSAFSQGQQNAKPQQVNSTIELKKQLTNKSQKGFKLKIDKSVFVHEKKGKIKAKYRILETLGKGSYGEVKKIQSKANGEFRAMKIIRKEDVSKEYVQSLMNEIEILKQLDHPNIVRIYEFYQDKASFYLITEFIEGGELFDKIAKIKSFSEANAAKIMKQLLSAVVYCHHKKIVHRDLKPENLLLQCKNTDTIKVIDFGTSRVFDPNVKMNHKYGTPYYIAPEVLNKYYDEKCDVWSCGVIMYILLCGYPPFKGKNHKEIFEKIKTGKFSFSANEWKNVTREAKVMIKKMLTYSPEERVSAEEALNNEWVIQNAGNNESDLNEKFHQPIMLDIMNNVGKINIQQKMQQAVLTYFANYLNVDEEKQKLLEIFQTFDKNGDGQLDISELIEGYTQYFDGDAERATKEAKDIMEKLDFNNNGSIDYSEFLIAHLDSAKFVSEAKLREVFNLFDIDQSGTITVDEIKKILGSGGAVHDIDDNEWERILDEVDSDGNGEISFQEFKDMIYKLFSMQVVKNDESNNDYEANMVTLKQSHSYLQSQPTDNNNHVTLTNKKRRKVVKSTIRTINKKKSMKIPKLLNTSAEQINKSATKKV